MKQVTINGRIGRIIDILPKHIICEDGNIYKLDGSLFKYDVVRSGYKRIRTYSKGKASRFLVHRLIAHAFLGIVLIDNSKKWVVDHINRNKMDNRISNLRYVTARQNSTNFREDFGAGTPINGIYYPRIKINSKRIRLGSFRNKNDAISVYRDKYDEITKIEEAELSENGYDKELLKTIKQFNN